MTPWTSVRGVLRVGDREASLTINRDKVGAWWWRVGYDTFQRGWSLEDAMEKCEAEAKAVLGKP